MAENSSNKAELVAIYRLEFYKKKNNWKLTHDQPKKVEKKPERPKCPVIPPKPVDFNKTYNIVVEPEPDIQDVSVLNQAFVETDHNLAESEKLYLEDRPHVAEELYVNSQPEWCQEVYQEPEKLAPDMWHMEQQDWVPCPQYAVGADVGYSPGWPVAAQHWTHATPHLDCFDGPRGALQCGRELVSREQRLGAGWASPEHWADHTQDHSTLSDDSVAEFMRGAHSAPHSSEIDLLSDSSESVCHLSSRQLAAGVSHHASLLRDLLAEAHLRDYTMQASVESLPGRVAEYPPHDFIAGSFQQGGLLGVEAGRGRGRREPLIRIGMGRPYRL